MSDDLPEYSPKAQQRLDKIHALIQDSAQMDPAPVTLSDHDQRAIDDEDEFIRRFGADWPRASREALLQFKYACDYTDREIKRLYRSGNLKRHARTVCNLASRPKYWVGLVMIIWFHLIFLSPLALSWHRIQSSSVLALKAAVVVALVVFFSWATYLVFIQPWRLAIRSRSALN